MPLSDVAEAVWYGDALASRAARACLAPASALFGAIVARVNARYDAEPVAPGIIPSISIGNLTVGGTGKTPVSAWFAQQFRAAGARPAIVMRGYGDDEMLVHRLLNPDVPVFGRAERTLGVEDAALNGADLAILDDAFQHRRAARVVDVVLMSADRWAGRATLLPAGPFREPMRSLRRATLVIVTVKAADPERIGILESAIRVETFAPVVTVDLAPSSFVATATSAVEPVAAWRGKRVLAVSGIGDPEAFSAQLRALGVAPVALSFPDHHAYGARSVERIEQSMKGMDAVVCTLKDAVKLAPLWSSSNVPLWYLSQSVIPRDGIDALNAAVQTMLSARRASPPLPDLSR